MQQRASVARSGASPVQDPRYKWKVLASVIFGIFMVILDTTVVNVAFQTLRREFGASLSDAQWIISIYVLSLGISTPMAGFMADRFGMKKMYIAGLAIFVLGSVLCGLAPNLGTLIAARALQGAGGGLAMPLGSALLFTSFPPHEQGMALGIFGIALVVAPALGPILGGFLVDRELWHWIFFINVPIGIIGVLLSFRFLRERVGTLRPRFDILGLATEVVGFGALLYGASLASTHGWGAPEVLISFGIGLGGLAWFAFIELYAARDPLLDLRLYQKPRFLVASLVGYVSVVALFGAEFLMPVYLQALRGFTALETGIRLLPLAFAAGIFTPLAGRLYDRIGPRPLLVAGFGLLVANTWQLGQIGADTSVNWIMVLLALRGVALGLTVQTTFVTALGVVPLRGMARGSSLTNATRQVVQSVGVALLATVLSSTLSPEVQAMQRQFQDQVPAPGQKPFALCSDPAAVAQRIVEQATKGGAAAPSGAAAQLASTGAPVGSAAAGGPPIAAITSMVGRACRESIEGFERAYTLTFYAAILAMLLGATLPGWPGKWTGRGQPGAPAPGGH